MKTLQRLAIIILVLVGAFWLWLALSSGPARGSEPEALIFGLVIVDAPAARLGLRFFTPLISGVCRYHGGELIAHERPGEYSPAEGEVVETVEIVVVCRAVVESGSGMARGSSKQPVSRPNAETGGMGWL